MDFHVSRFGGGLQETSILPFTLLVTVIAIGLMLCLPRKGLIAPFLVASILIPLGQVVVVGSFHFGVNRILIFAAWIRLLSTGALANSKRFGFTASPIDKAVVLWALCSAIAFVALFRDPGAFTNRLGFLYSTLGTYFILRFFIQRIDDADLTIKVFAAICALLAVSMTIEKLTGRNPIAAIFGGVAEFSQVRDGSLRSQGPFGHAILAGTFGAVLVPLFVGMWKRGRGFRLVAALGVVSTTTITITSSSSTPLMAYAAGIGGLCFWPFRKNMRLFRWGLVLLLVSLHIVMKAPVWSLIGRLDLTGSSSGYHRYMLVDQAIRHFGDWWLFGVKDTATWGWDLGDTANQYVEVATTGGLATLVLFISTITRGFRTIGQTRKAMEADPQFAQYVWSFGAALFANVVAFIGISYFDQTQTLWLALLAMIASVHRSDSVRPDLSHVDEEGDFAGRELSFLSETSILSGRTI